MPFLRKYGTGTGADVIIPIVKAGEVNFAVSADWTPASGDVQVSKDGGTAANVGTLPAYITGIGWKFVFSDAELQCKRLNVNVVDSATKAVEDQHIVIETYGHASAMHPFDLGTASTAQTGDTYALASGASGFVATKAVLDEAAADVANIDGEAMRGTDGAYTGTPPTAAAIADQVWDEATSGHTTTGTFGEQVKTSTDTILARLGSWTGTGVNTVLGAFKALLSKDASTPSDIGGTFDPEADSTEAISEAVAGLALSSGSGNFTLTITVNDGTNNLQNALVRVKEGVTDLRVLTNSSGQALFSVDAATYNIYITKSGYQFTPTTLAISADASQTYSMTAVAITPSAENTVTGYHICYDSSANPKSGVTHTLIQLTPGTLSASYDSTPREVTSAVSTGLVQFTGLHVGASYKYIRGDTKKHTTFTVPSDAEDTWEMDSVVGSP